MGKDRQQLLPLDVIEEIADFLRSQRTRKPLHVVLDEYLHDGAAD